jgi:hypothetical protein
LRGHIQPSNVNSDQRSLHKNNLFACPTFLLANFINHLLSVLNSHILAFQYSHLNKASSCSGPPKSTLSKFLHHILHGLLFHCMQLLWINLCKFNLPTYNCISLDVPHGYHHLASP